MKVTGEMQHWNIGGGSRPGGGSIIGLPVLVDDEGNEFVYYKRWDAREAVLTHVDEVPHLSRCIG